MEIKSFIIRLLGGISTEDKAELLKEKQTAIEDSYRVGDLIYVIEGPLKSISPRYIIKLYGGMIGRCCIVHHDKDIKPDSISEVHNGVQLSDISREKPCKCHECGTILK